MPTIAAIASPAGPARRGIVRISGPATGGLLGRTLQLCDPPFDPSCARSVHRARFDDGRGLQPARVLWMRGPRSYTREDMAELHLPGAEPLLAAALERLLAAGARAARAGEFTRRAFENGRLDLSQAEGVLALTEAAGEDERRAALGLVTGGLERRTRALREALLDLASLCEASLDFDESDTGHVATRDLELRAAKVSELLEEALRWELARATPRGLARVVLVGAPSVGKSTLWNALTGGQALVSEQAGTTRDYQEGLWDLGPGSCLLIDGPGLRGPGSEVETRAQELFARARARADLVLLVCDAAADPGPVPGDARLVVRARADRPDHAGGLSDAGGRETTPIRPASPPAVTVSAHRGQGFEALAREVARELGLADDLVSAPESGLERGLHLRHRAALERARVEFVEARRGLRCGLPLDVVAEALRGAREALEELAGRTTPEDVLERLFARFCIGK